MYRDVKFRTIDLDRIESDIKEINYIVSKVPRIFLVNGDAFVLSANRLKTIACKIRKILLECRTISMYAAIRNIRQKTDEQLRELRALGISELHIGVETGDGEVLKSINKGHTLDEAYEQLERLNQAGIDHNSSLMLGIAGKGNGMNNARKTAEFINRTKPKIVWISTTSFFKGTPLSQQLSNREFEQASELEMLEEEKELLRSIQLSDVKVYGVHPTNTAKVSGFLPVNREKMINSIDATITEYGKDALSKTFDRLTL
jgi:radical SAM superfamily enzyme YgiQ (UPF0313 family)